MKLSGAARRNIHSPHLIAWCVLPMHGPNAGPSTAACNCGVILTAPTGAIRATAHEPIENAYAEHRRKAGAGEPHPIGHDRTGYRFNGPIERAS